jgi:hypothetical protein
MVKFTVKSRGTKLDFTGTAASVVSQAIGAGLFTGDLLPDLDAGKDPKAIARGEEGGLKGGKARAEKLSLSALSHYFMFYNFCRVHQTLRVTPAMEAGIADHVWDIEEVVALLPEPEFGPRGPYKKG